MSLKKRLEKVLQRLPDDLSDDLTRFVADQYVNHSTDCSEAIAEAIALGRDEACRKRSEARVKKIVEFATSGKEVIE